MAFGKWRLSRGRKTSSSSSEHDPSGTSTPATSGASTPSGNTSPGGSQGSSELKSESRGLVRVLTDTLGKQSKPRRASKSAYPHLHKPFTKQNLEHQKVLNNFEWSFGRKMSAGSWSICSGISPCSSRRASVDLDYALPPGMRDTRRASGASSTPDAQELALLMSKISTSGSEGYHL